MNKDLKKEKIKLFAYGADNHRRNELRGTSESEKGVNKEKTGDNLKDTIFYTPRLP